MTRFSAYCPTADIETAAHAPPGVPQLDFMSHIQTLPQWQRRLFFNLTHLGSNLSQALLTNSLLIASRGAIAQSQGGFSWVLGTSQTIFLDMLWSCRWCVYMYEHTTL